VRLRSIEHRLEPVPGVEGEYRLVFDVVEGERVAVAEIVFDGNEAFSQRDLERAMQTRGRASSGSGPGCSTRRRSGPTCARTCRISMAAMAIIDFTMLGDTLIVDPETGKARIEIQVDGGGAVPAGGVRHPRQPAVPHGRPATLLRSAAGGSAGGDRDRRDRRRGGSGRRADARVQPVALQPGDGRCPQAYRNQGYLYSQVCRSWSGRARRTGEPAVRVGWEIVENDPAYINRVHIVGNTYTHENVIRDRIFVLPGDVYSEDLLIQSYRSIMGLGFFESPLPTPRMEPTENG
jgi:outer membrane protein insertion porin family